MDRVDKQARSAGKLGGVSTSTGRFGGFSFPKAVPKVTPKGNGAKAVCDQSLGPVRDVTGERSVSRMLNNYAKNPPDEGRSGVIAASGKLLRRFLG